jgi:hypothetical protein
VVLPTTTWSLSERNRLGETTSSASAGRATWLGGVTEADFQCEVLFDSTALLNTTISPGAAITCKFLIGDSTKFFTGSGVIETIVHKVNNLGGDVVKADITGKYSGTLTQPV